MTSSLFLCVVFVVIFFSFPFCPNVTLQELGELAWVLWVGVFFSVCVCVVLFGFGLFSCVVSCFF